jgi:hypothetical protein
MLGKFEIQILSKKSNMKLFGVTFDRLLRFQTQRR